MSYDNIVVLYRPQDVIDFLQSEKVSFPIPKTRDEVVDVQTNQIIRNKYNKFYLFCKLYMGRVLDKAYAKEQLDILACLNTEYLTDATFDILNCYGLSPIPHR